MRLFGQMMLYALLGVFAQNLVFTRGVGSNRLLRLVKKPKDMGICCALITVFTLACALSSLPVQRLLAQNNAWQLYTVVYYVAVDCVLYGVAALLLKTVFRRWRGRVMPLLSSCAFNCVVLSVPLIGQQSALSVEKLAGYSLGAGIGFFVALLLVADAVSRLDNPDMAEGFLGLPSVFLYLGVLSMAFLGFAN